MKKCFINRIIAQQVYGDPPKRNANTNRHTNIYTHTHTLTHSLTHSHHRGKLTPDFC